MPLSRKDAAKARLFEALAGEPLPADSVPTKTDWRGLGRRDPEPGIEYELIARPDPGVVAYETRFRASRDGSDVTADVAAVMGLKMTKAGAAVVPDYVGGTVVENTLLDKLGHALSGITHFPGRSRTETPVCDRLYAEQAAEVAAAKTARDSWLASPVLAGEATAGWEGLRAAFGKLPLEAACGLWDTSDDPRGPAVGRGEISDTHCRSIMKGVCDDRSQWVTRGEPYPLPGSPGYMLTPVKTGASQPLSLVLTHAGKPVGMLHRPGLDGDLLYVAPEHRGKGLAAQLVVAGLKARAAACEKAGLACESTWEDMRSRLFDPGSYSKSGLLALRAAHKLAQAEVGREHEQAPTLPSPKRTGRIGRDAGLAM